MSIAERFLAPEHAGVACSQYLEAYCNSYLQSSDRDTNLFPTGLAGDANGYQFFRSTFSAPTPGTNYADFCSALQNLGQQATQSPEDIFGEMKSYQWLNNSLFDPSTLAENVDLQTLFLNLSTDDSNSDCASDSSFEHTFFQA